MAFTAAPIIKLVSDGLVRLSAGEDGFALLEGDSGTIALHEYVGSPGVNLPAGFMPRPFAAEGGVESMQDSIQVEITYTATGLTVQPIKAVKTGTSPVDFLITLTNDAAVPEVAVGSGDLEIYIRFH